MFLAVALHAQHFQVVQRISPALALVLPMVRDSALFNPPPTAHATPVIPLIHLAVKGNQLLTFEAGGFHENPTTLSSSSRLTLSPHADRKASMQSENTWRNAVSSIFSKAIESASKIVLPFGTWIVT